MEWTPKYMVKALWERGYTSAHIARTLGVAVTTVTRAGQGKATGSVLIEKGIRELLLKLLHEERTAVEIEGKQND